MGLKTPAVKNWGKKTKGKSWSAARRLGMSPKNGLLLLALYWLALLTFRLVAILLLDRVRHGRLLGGSVLAAVFGIFLLYFTDNGFGAATGAVLVGCGFASIYPLLTEKVGRSFPFYNPAFFNGIFSFAITGGLLAPATLGYFAALAGIGVVMALPLAGGFMVIFLLLLIWLEAKVTGQ
jgi:MFS family permease